MKIRWAFQSWPQHFPEASPKIWLYMLVVPFQFWIDINPTGDIPRSWFDAQSHCVGQGLTIEKDKSDQPYWTGVYRRLSPWINILGQYVFAFFFHWSIFLFNIILNIWSILMICLIVFNLLYNFTWLNKFESVCFV